MPINWTRIRSRFERGDLSDGTANDRRTRDAAMKFCDFLVKASEEEASDERYFINEFFLTLNKTSGEVPLGVRVTPETRLRTH